jgi:hypothetical protein
MNIYVVFLKKHYSLIKYLQDLRFSYIIIQLFNYSRNKIISLFKIKKCHVK